MGFCNFRIVDLPKSEIFPFVFFKEYFNKRTFLFLIQWPLKYFKSEPIVFVTIRIDYLYGNDDLLKLISGTIANYHLEDPTDVEYSAFALTPSFVLSPLWPFSMRVCIDQWVENLSGVSIVICLKTMSNKNIESKHFNFRA